ncbi:MAG: hypothetical protein NTW19_13270 [Planctomycetota bacterium]|nr:hypothetical protein [Planctomycetota bacterium]
MTPTTPPPPPDLKPISADPLPPPIPARRPRHLGLAACPECGQRMRLFQSGLTVKYDCSGCGAMLTISGIKTPGDVLATVLSGAFGMSAIYAFKYAFMLAATGHPFAGLLAALAWIAAFGFFLSLAPSFLSTPRLRLKKDRCLGCGHDLRGPSGPACPVCGKPID